MRRFAVWACVALVGGASAAPAQSAGGWSPAAAGQDLLDWGLLPHARSVTSAAANPVGGQSQGVDASGVIIFGADADGARLLDLPGTLLHANFAQLYGHELSTDHIGARTKVQSYYYPYKQFELSELTLEQPFWDGRVVVVAGRANATGDFARSLYGCQFQNVSDCPLELTQAAGGFPGFPYVNWGGRIRVNLANGWSVKGGAFEVNPTRNRNNGFDWSTNAATGLVLPAELGFGRPDRHMTLGGWINSAPVTDPYFNTSGRSRGAVGGPPEVYNGGRSGVYALVDQRLWGTQTRGVAVFGTMAAPLDEHELFAGQALAGLVWSGPFIARPGDRLGLQASYLRLSNRELGYLDAKLTRQGSSDRLSRSEWNLELDYRIRLRRGIALTPNIQGVINPDTIARPDSNRAPADALVLGVKFTIEGGPLLGLPGTLGERAGAAE